MKKLLLLATTLLLSISSFASQYEFVNDKYCVYAINVGEQTAKVVNFYSEASSVTIPSSFVYQGDKYIVTSIGYNDFQTKVHEDWYGNAVIESYGKYTFEDYDKNRACIVELNLPNTLEEIGTDAFKGMTRIKNLRIPSKVTKLSGKSFGGNSRLEVITIESMPCIQYWWYSDEICLVNVDDPMAITEKAKTEWKRNVCPRLQQIEILPLKDYSTCKEKLHQSYLKYSKQLRDTIAAYNTRLNNHPYYVEGEYLSGIFISYPSLSITNAKEDYAVKSSALKKEYNDKIAVCREKYQEVNNNMEKLCKLTSPEVYADKYCALHPDFSEQIDIMLNDYKCKYSKSKLASLVLRNHNLGEKCQDELWKQYKHLYKNNEDFLTDYNKSTQIISELIERQGIYDDLIHIIQGGKLSVKGLYDSDDNSSQARTFRNRYQKVKENNIPITTSILSQDPKAQKEYLKNGQYFSGIDEFFDTYIKSEYGHILKEKKKISK